MKCVVPLAGPDLEHSDHGFRPMVPCDGEPLLQKALDGRPWRMHLASSDYLFVVRETPAIARLIDWLVARWPGAGIVRLPGLTGGALFSALAGVAALTMDEDEAVIVDLADILFDGPPALFDGLEDGTAGAVVPCFVSDEPCYSYLREEGDLVVEAAEKQVISSKASAGVYGFTNRSLFTAAASHSIRDRQHLAYQGNLFVCPMMNGVIAEGQRVLAPMVENVRPISKSFHHDETERFGEE